MSDLLANLGTGMSVASGATNIVGGLADLFTRKKRREEQYMREDNAVQRRAADLEAAGLSKTLAAGSASSAAPISTRLTQTSTDVSGAVLKSAQGALIKAQTGVSNSQIKLNEALASKANTEAGNLVLLRPKIGSEGTLLHDKAMNVPRERELFETIGWTYYKDMPGISGEIGRTLSSLATSTTGIAKTTFAKLEPIARELSNKTFATIEQGNNWIQEQIDKIPELIGDARAGAIQIFENVFRRNRQ